MGEKYRLFGVQEFTISLTKGKDTSLFSPGGIFIEGKLNLEKLERSIQKLVNESDAMRFVFERDETTNTIYQRVLDSYRYKLDVRDLVGETKEEKEEYLKKDFYKATEKIEYLPDGNVKWCCILYRYSDKEYGLWLAMSHILADGLSIANAITRIVLRYNGIPLPPVSSYLEYIKEQYKLETNPECAKLREPVIESLKSYVPPVDYSEMGRVKSYYRELVTMDITELKKFARANKMSVFYCTLFMFHAAIAATYNAKDSLIGVAVGIRKLKDKLSIGEFLTGYIDRNTFSEDSSLQEMAVKCKYRYLDESKEDIAVYDTIKQGTEFILAYQNFGNAPKKIKMGKAVAKLYDNIEKFIKPINWASLSLDAYESGDELALMAGFDDELFDDETLNRMKNAFIIANKGLSGRDMSFKEYCELVKSSSK